MPRKIDLIISPEANCTKWNECSINKCPLSRNYHKLKNDPSDPSKKNKERCASRNIRKQIGKAFKLKLGGLTKGEYAGANFKLKTTLNKEIHKSTQENSFNSNLHGGKSEKAKFNHNVAEPETKDCEVYNK